MHAEPEKIYSTGHLALSDVEWEQAQSRSELIGKLAERDVVGVAAADEAAMKLGVS